MNYLNEKIKRNAKEMLRKNWGKAMIITVAIAASVIMSWMLENVLATLLGVQSLSALVTAYSDTPQQLVNMLLPSLMMTMLSSLLLLLISRPLMLGANSWYFRLTYGEEQVDTSELFTFFSTVQGLLRSAWLFLNTYIRTVFYCTVLVIPGIVMLLISTQFTIGSPSSVDRVMAVMGSAIGICLLGLGLIVAWIFAQRYFLAPYIICDDRSISVRNAIAISIKATKGYKSGIAWFKFSFIGWQMLSVVLLLPTLYTAPYISASYALYARSLMDFKCLTLERRREEYQRFVQFSQETQGAENLAQQGPI